MTHIPDGTEDGEHPTAFGYYDACLGGDANNAADRALMMQAEAASRGSSGKVRDARRFLAEGAGWAAREHRISAWVENEAWLPGRGRPLHAAVRDHVPGARYVYSTSDPVARGRLENLAEGIPGVHVFEAWHARPGTTLTRLRAARIISMEERVVMMLPMLLHYASAPLAAEILSANAGLLPAGSVLLVSWGIPPESGPAREFIDAHSPRRFHSHAIGEVREWMHAAGLRLAGPGITDCRTWKPWPDEPVFRPEPFGRVVGAAAVVRG